MRTVATIPIAFGFYLLLAGAVGTEQLVSAAAMTVFVLVWSGAIRRFGSGRGFAFTAAHAAPWLRAIGKLPSDTVRIGAILVRAAVLGGSPGRAARPAFRFGPGDDARDSARRASAIIAGSLTPDTFVVDIAPGRSDALCHKLAKTAPPSNAEWLA